MPNRRTLLLAASAAVAGTAGGAAWSATGGRRDGSAGSDLLRSRPVAAVAASAGLPLTVVNHTAVDMFSVPMALRLRGTADQTTGRLATGGRAAIFDAMRAHPTFAPLVVDDTRVIAPGHGLDAGIFPATYCDGYIDTVWNQYASRQLTVNTGTRTHVGTVSGGQLRFDGQVAPFARPSTRDVLFCHGALAAPNDGVTGPVAAVLGAGFNRSTLLTQSSQPATDPSSFYRDQTTNHYARALHEHTEDGRAYGFAFDDVAGFASYIQDTAPASATLWLTPF